MDAPLYPSGTFTSLPCSFRPRKYAIFLPSAKIQHQPRFDVTARTCIDFRRPIPLRGIHRAVVLYATREDIRCALVRVVALFWLNGVHDGYSIYVLWFGEWRMHHKSDV